MHRLLALDWVVDGARRNAWYEARDAAGDPAGYVADVAVARRLADDACATEISHGEAAPSAALALRYSLVTTSIRSIAGNVPPGLVLALVRTGVWTAEKGVAYARQDPSAYSRVETLARIVPLVEAALRETLAFEALTAARDVGGMQQADLLASFAPDVPDAALGEALSLAGKITTPPTDEGADSLRKAWLALVSRLPVADAVVAARKDVPGWTRAAALACAGSRADEPLRSEVLDEALDLALAGNSDLGVATSLEHMAPYLTEATQVRALGAAAALNQTSRQLALEALTPFLAPAAAEHALEPVATLEQPARAFAALAACVAPERREETMTRAVGAARAVSHDWIRAGTLADIGPRLAGAALDAAVADALAIKDPGSRATALAGLVDGLTGRRKQRALGQLLDAALADTSDSRAHSLAFAAPHLPVPLKRKALRAARSLADEQRRLLAYEAILPGLPEPEALDAVLELGGEDSRAKALAALAPESPPELLRRAIASAFEISNPSYRRDALDGLIPHLPRELLLEVLTRVRATGDDALGLAAVAALAEECSEPVRAEVLSRALEDARGLSEGLDRVRALSELATRFPEPTASKLLGEALRDADAIEDDRARRSGLTALGPRLPAALAEQAVDTARTLDNGDWDVYTAAGAIARLPEPRRAEVVAEAFEAAFASEEPSAWEVAITALAPLLSESLAERAYEAAKGIQPGFLQGRAIAALAPRLPETLVPEAIALAETFNPGTGAQALAALVPRLPRAEAIAAAAELTGGHNRAQALLALAPWTTPELPAVLPAAREIEEPVWRARVLFALRPAATEPLADALLDEAVEATGEIPFDEPRAETLAFAAPQLLALPSARLLAVWQRVLASLETHSRSDVLRAVAAVAPVISRLGGDGAAHESVRAVRDVAAWWP